MPGGGGYQEQRAEGAARGRRDTRAPPALCSKPARADAPTTIPDPLGAGTLKIAVTRFGVADDSGSVVACSRNPDFPTEQDRLLLGVAANQTAVVVQRRQAEQPRTGAARVAAGDAGRAWATPSSQPTSAVVTYLNSVAEQLTGWTLDDATGKPVATVFSILNEETLQPVESPVQKVLREGSVSGPSESHGIGREGWNAAPDR